MSTANPPPGRGSRLACWPIHAVMPASVVRYSNTTSGGASISIEVAYSAMIIFLLRLDHGFQLRESRRPEVVQVRPNRSKPIRVHGEQMPRAVLGAAGEPGRVKHAQMVRGRLLRQTDLFGDLTHRARTVPNQSQDRAAIRVSQRPQCQI